MRAELGVRVRGIFTDYCRLLLHSSTKEMPSIVESHVHFYDVIRVIPGVGLLYCSSHGVYKISQGQSFFGKGAEVPKWGASGTVRCIATVVCFERQ